jgi:hypothetical protein
MSEDKANKLKVIVGSTAGGSTDQDGIHTINYGETLAITASADDGFRFIGWSVDAFGRANTLDRANPLVAVVTSDMAIAANFAIRGSEIHLGQEKASFPTLDDIGPEVETGTQIGPYEILSKLGADGSRRSGMSEEKERNENDSKKTEEADFPTLSYMDPVVEIGTQIGPYKILDIMGEGGFGIVYKAVQKEPLRRMVALKVIKPGMDFKEVITRFDFERQVLALLKHPNIARVYDAGTTEAGRPYFVMEFVREGQPITEYCDQLRLSIYERLRLFLLVCGGIQYAHQKGIIHRDIKPSNVLVPMPSPSYAVIKLEGCF